MRHLISFIGLASGLITTAAAQDTPIVQVYMEPQVVAVGEPAQMQVKILVPTWFPRPPVFPSFELANAITRLPPDSSYPTSERVGRDTWSGIIRNYQVYPLLGATYRLSGQTITVTYADPNTSRPITVEVDVPEYEFQAQVPSGAEGLKPYIAGSNFTLTRDIEGDPHSLQVGDALVLRYTAELDGLPAIFLPPLASQFDIPGVSIYADEPLIEDNGRARRIEKLTFVFAAGGEFSVSELSLDWWNTETGAIERASLPQMTLTVSGPAPEVIAEGPQPFRWPTITLAIAGLFLIVLATARWIPELYRKYSAYKERKRLTETFAFKQLRQALRSRDARTAHHALLRWLARLDPCLDVRQFAQTYGHEALLAKTERLSSALYSNRFETSDWHSLLKPLATARQRYKSSASSRNRFAVPPMNP